MWNVDDEPSLKRFVGPFNAITGLYGDELDCKLVGSCRLWTCSVCELSSVDVCAC